MKLNIKATKTTRYNNEPERREQPRWFDGTRGKVPKTYDAETINSDLEALDKSRSMNGEEAKKLAIAAKERGKSDGFVTGALVVGIAWASNAATKFLLKKLKEA